MYLPKNSLSSQDSPTSKRSFQGKTTINSSVIWPVLSEPIISINDNTYLLYYCIDKQLIRPVGLFVGKIKQEYKQIVPYVLRRSNGHVVWTQLDKSNFRLMHDYKYVMETDVSSDYTNGLTINSSHSSMVYVYGEIEHGFSFTGSGRLKLIGNFFYGHWHKDGLQESPIVRNCTIELSDGIANVFICDFREITIMTNRRAKMQVFCVNKHDSKKSHMIYENIPLNEQKSETEKDTIQERILFDKTICKVQSQERNSKIKRKISKSLLVSKSINIFNDPEMVQTLRKLSEQYFLKKPVQSEQINLNEKTDLKLQSAKNQSLQSNETNKTASTFGSLQSTISNQESPIHSKVIFAEQILPELNKVCNSKTGMVQKIRIKLELAEIMRKWKVLTSSGISKLKQKTNKQLQCELNLLENKVEHLTILLHHFISCIPKQVKLSQNVNELKSCSLKLDTKNFAQYSSQFYEILQRIENQLIDIKL